MLSDVQRREWPKIKYTLNRIENNSFRLDFQKKTNFNYIADSPFNLQDDSSYLKSESAPSKQTVLGSSQFLTNRIIVIILSKPEKFSVIL